MDLAIGIVSAFRILSSSRTSMDVYAACFCTLIFFMFGNFDASQETSILVVFSGFRRLLTRFFSLSGTHWTCLDSIRVYIDSSMLFQLLNVSFFPIPLYSPDCIDNFDLYPRVLWCPVINFSVAHTLLLCYDLSLCYHVHWLIYVFAHMTYVDATVTYGEIISSCTLRLFSLGTFPRDIAFFFAVYFSFPSAILSYYLLAAPRVGIMSLLVLLHDPFNKCHIYGYNPLQQLFFDTLYPMFPTLESRHHTCGWEGIVSCCCTVPGLQCQRKLQNILPVHPCECWRHF